MSKRIGCWILALAMVATLLPAFALPAYADTVYSVTFERNGGGGTMASVEVAAGASYTLPECTFSAPTAYTEFDKWRIGDSYYAPGASITVNANVTVMATWKDKYCTVTFLKNNDAATGTMDDQSIKAGPQDPKPQLNKNQYKLTDYTFLEWTTKADGTGSHYNDRQSVELYGDLTLYAQWGKEILTVTFDKNNDAATGEMDPQLFARGVGTQLNKNAFTLDGYTFAGWNTQADGLGETYVDEKIFSLTEDLTLYAMWEKTKIKVVYNANAQGVVGMDSLQPQLKAQGQALTLHSYKPEREGYVFNGWSTDSTAAQATYQPGGTLELDTLAVNGVITLYAVWGKKDIMVTFSANGGYGSMSGQSFKNGVEDALKANDFARSGRQFKYWSTEKDGSGAIYTDKQKTTFSEDTTLYAIWDPSVVYHGNNGTTEQFVQLLTLGGSTVMKENTFTRKGYYFKCWNTKADGSGTDYQVKQTVRLDETTELYAMWTPYRYSVRFHPNGGVGTMSEQKFEYDKAQALTANAYTRTGRTFQGWSLTPGGEVDFKDKASVKNLSEQDGKTVLLYAVWGTGTNSGKDTPAGSIWLQQGGSILQSTTPKDGDPYVFKDVRAGVYNVVVTSGDRKQTTLVTLTQTGEVKGPSQLSPESANSVLELKNGAPDVVVGNLDLAAQDNRVSGAKTELTLTVERVSENSANEQHRALRALCPEGKELELLDLTLTKSVEGKEDGSFSGECSENLLLYIPFTKAATKDITVLRVHDGKTATLTTRKQEEEYIEVTDSMVVIHAKRFSLYAICYTPREPEISYLNCPRNQKCPIQPFDDASPTSWYHDGVHWAMEHGVMNGVTARRFKPNDPTTRAQLVTILWRMEGSPSGYYAFFADVPDNAWYATAVGWASSSGIITGRSDTSFDPNGMLSREQMCTILYRYVCSKGWYQNAETVGLGGFADAQSVSSWARAGMDWATSYAVLDGLATTDGRRLLAPKGIATRAQIATVMLRCWEGFLQ